MLLAPMFLALGAVATSALNAHRRFAASAIAPIVYDLAIIGAAFLLAPGMGVTGLAVGVVAGSLLHLLVQLPALSRAGFRFTPSLDASDPDVAQTLELMAPRALALGAGQITFIVATALASGLDAGLGHGVHARVHRVLDPAVGHRRAARDRRAADAVPRPGARRDRRVRRASSRGRCG